MRRNRVTALIALCLIGLLTFGCNLLPLKKPQVKKDGGGEKTKVFVSMGNTAVDNYAVLQSQLQEMGKDKQLEFTWSDSRNDALQQASEIAKAAKEKAKVVIVEPVEPDMLKSGLQDLQKQGIKIICLGNLPSDMPVDAYITPDFRRAGEIQGQQVLEKAGATGKPLKILILRGPNNNKSAEAILAGNMAVLQGNKNVASVSVETVEGWNASTTFTLVQSKLSQGTPPQAILAHSPEITAGMIQAVEKKALQGQVKTYGMGTQVKAVEALGQGKHAAEVDYMPEMLAQTLVDAVKSLSTGQSWQYERQVQNGTHNVPAKFIPIRSITVDNLYLLKERMEKMKKAEEKQSGEQGGGGQEKGGGQSGGGSNQGGSGGGSGEGSGSGGEKGGSEKGQGQKKTTLKITTKDGNTFQMEIAGEVQSVEVNGGTASKGGQGGSQGSEGSQGGGGGSGQGGGAGK